MNAAVFATWPTWPATPLMEGALLALVWLAVATMRRRATATWLRTWWRVLFAVMLGLGAASFAPVKWRIPVPAFHAAVESQVTVSPPREMPVAQVATVSAPPPRLDAAPMASAALSRPISWRALWAAGASLLLARAALSAWRVRRLIREAKPINGEGWLEDLEREIRSSAYTGNVPLLVHPGVRVPFAAGCFRPRIVLPTEAERWEAAERRAVLHHEFEHLRNRDLAWQWLAEAVAILHWPNPFLWMARRRLLLAQEMAVDDAVLAGGVSSVDYAALLTEVARQGRALSQQPALVPMAHESNLGRRVSRLLDSNQRRGSLSVAARIAMALAGMACVFVCGFVGFRAEEQTPAVIGDSRSASAASKAMQDARGRVSRETLHLEKAFADHFHGSSEDALQALRQELKAAQVILPSTAKLELNPGKDTLIVDYPVKDQVAVEAAEAFLVHSGWSAGKPKNNGFLGDAKALRQFTEAVDQQREKVIEEGKAAALALHELNIVDNDPWHASAPVTSPDPSVQAMESAVIEKLNRVNVAKAHIANFEKLPPERIADALRILGIEIPIVEKTLPLFEKGSAEERRLLSGGMAADSPSVKELHGKNELYRETLRKALLNIRSAEETKLKIAKTELENSEQTLRAATSNAARTKQQVFDYVNAKTVYLEDKRILDIMYLQYAAELAKYRAKQEAPPEAEKKP